MTDVFFKLLVCNSIFLIVFFSIGKDEVFFFLTFSILCCNFCIRIPSLPEPLPKNDRGYFAEQAAACGGIKGPFLQLLTGTEVVLITEVATRKF